MNLPHQERTSLPSSAAGVQGSLDFRALIQAHPLHPSSLTIARRSAAFAPGRTFGMYVRHVEKAFLLMGMRVEWRTPAVQAAIDGMANAPVSRSRFANILSFVDLHRLLKHDTSATDFGRLGYFSFLFLLRLLSEALPIAMALADDPSFLTRRHRGRRF